MSTKRASNRQTPKWKNSAYAGTRLIRTGTTLSNLVLKVFLSQLRTDYCSGSPKLFSQWDQRRRAERVLQPAAEIPVGEQVQTQHGSQIGEGPLRLGEMVQPFQQQHGDQRCPNLDQQRIPAGAHKTLHFQVLFEGFEKQFNFPPVLVDGGDGGGPEVQEIGQQDDLPLVDWIPN